LPVDGGDVPGQEVILREIDATLLPSPIGIFANEADSESLATVPTSLHADLQAILDTGLDLQTQLADGVLTVHLIESE